MAEALNGEQGLAQCAAEEPALIVLDLLMPVMSGAEFVLRYRARPAAVAKIILLSAVTEREAVASTLDIDEVIGKPFDIEQLLGTARRVLQN